MEYNVSINYAKNRAVELVQTIKDVDIFLNNWCHMSLEKIITPWIRIEEKYCLYYMLMWSWS